jgi:hypothetical protein
LPKKTPQKLYLKSNKPRKINLFFFKIFISNEQLLPIMFLYFAKTTLTLLLFLCSVLQSNPESSMYVLVEMLDQEFEQSNKSYNKKKKKTLYAGKAVLKSCLLAKTKIGCPIFI